METQQMTADDFKELRRRLGWTRLELAIWSGASVRTIVRFEQGDQRVPQIWWRALESLVPSVGCINADIGASDE